ncbi:MAG: hypothetical protein L6420_04975 [Elusimicrobia bacterium]|nr:hypothetical protein [Elusimicrobiota bacterium]
MPKKILSLRESKKRKIIMHKVKVRVKVKKHFLKKASLTISWILLIGVFVLSLKTVYGFASDKMKSGIFSAEIKSLDIKIGNEKLNREISKLFNDRIGKRWNKGLKNGIKRELLSKRPYINDISVSKNILTGKVIISGELEKIVSKIELNGSKEHYLALSGKIFSSAYEEAVNQDFIRVEIHADKKPELKIFAEFINKINLSRKLFKLRPVLIKYSLSGEKCAIILEDNSLVNWGKFELTDQKILRLNSILDDIVGKIPAPHNVDLRHFAIGKIFISEL